MCSDHKIQQFASTIFEYFGEGAGTSLISALRNYCDKDPQLKTLWNLIEQWIGEDRIKTIDDFFDFDTVCDAIKLLTMTKHFAESLYDLAVVLPNYKDELVRQIAGLRTAVELLNSRLKHLLKELKPQTDKQSKRKNKNLLAIVSNMRQLSEDLGTAMKEVKTVLFAMTKAREDLTKKKENASLNMSLDALYAYHHHQNLN